MDRNILVMLKRLLSIALVFTAFFPKATAQEKREYPLPYVIEGNDTIFLSRIDAANVYGHRSVKSKREWKQYYRMVYNLKKVYPYSQIAKRKLAEMNAHFLQLETKKERKNYINRIEKELLAEFEGPLRKLTRSQGKMLIKLIDRETGQSSYEVVKELKGGFATFFWQNIGRLFGYNLKARYDPNGKDSVLEELVQMCENGTFDQLYYSMFSN